MEPAPTSVSRSGSSSGPNTEGLFSTVRHLIFPRTLAPIGRRIWRSLPSGLVTGSDAGSGFDLCTSSSLAELRFRGSAQSTLYKEMLIAPFAAGIAVPHFSSHQVLPFGITVTYSGD